MKSISEINAIRDLTRAQVVDRKADNKNLKTRVVVGLATCGMAAGAQAVLDTITKEVASRKLNNVEVTYAGCLGMCKLEPIVEIYVPGKPKITYIWVDAVKAADIVEKHLVGGKPCEDYMISADEK
jgi:NADP-reducing hydrogenase subunit HndB